MTESTKEEQSHECDFIVTVPCIHGLKCHACNRLLSDYGWRHYRT
jgi:hypothetical protein